MAKYYYDKYNVESEYGLASTWNWGNETLNKISSPSENYYSNVRVTNGLFVGVGSSTDLALSTPNGTVLYRIWNNGREVWRYRKTLNSGGWVMDVYTTRLLTSDLGGAIPKIGDIKGSLVESSIVAENGTYPNDGRHSDGYWYVRKSAQAPNAPTSLTLSKTSELKAGDVIIISWSGASDPEGELANHYLEVKRNSGNWTAVATKNTSSGSSSHSYTIPTGTSSIQFRVRVRDAQNLYSSYRETTTYSVITNTAPTISGTDRSLGDYALPFTVDFIVNDANPSDNISVRVTLNGTEIMNISGAPLNQPLTININKQLFDSLAVDSTNTIQIRADDGQGGIAYRTLTFKKTNTAPIISGNDKDLGIIEESPTYTYTVSDAEDDAITIVERVNSVVIREFQAVPNEEYTFSIPYEAWLHLWPQNEYTIYIEATDARGAKSVRSLSFKRKTDKSVITLKNPFETDVHAHRILLNPTVTIPTGAIFTAEACNNAFDDEPTWEDITERALEGRGYIFTNDTKIADKWGVNVQITLERGTATTPIILDGFGGAFD